VATCRLGAAGGVRSRRAGSLFRGGVASPSTPAGILSLERSQGDRHRGCLRGSLRPAAGAAGEAGGVAGVWFRARPTHRRWAVRRRDAGAPGFRLGRSGRAGGRRRDPGAGRQGCLLGCAGARAVWLDRRIRRDRVRRVCPRARGDGSTGMSRWGVSSPAAWRRSSGGADTQPWCLARA
jgi:hypothetical protein